MRQIVVADALGVGNMRNIPGQSGGRCQASGMSTTFDRERLSLWDLCSVNLAARLSFAGAASVEFGPAE